MKATLYVAGVLCIPIAISIGIVSLIAKDVTPKHIDSNINCAWSEKYNSCFCGNTQNMNSSVFTWAPKEVCGK